MRRSNLLRSTPFRLALGFALLFVCAFLVSGLVTYKLIEKELDRNYGQRTEELFHVISRTYDESDLQDLIDATRVHIAATRRTRDIFILRSADGRLLAGNGPPISLPDGWSTRTGTQLGLRNGYTYRLFAGSVGDNRLIVGTNDEETADLRRIVIAGFGWALLVVLALATGGGLLIALRAQRRLDAVGDTMGKVAHGDLTARVPLLGRGDDLDRLSSDINEALERLALAVESIRQVSTDVAHDLKTPLNRLRIVLEETQSDMEAGRTAKFGLQEALQEVDQINQTCEAILRIAQIETGSRKSRFGRVDLNRLLEDLADVYGEVAKDAGHILMRDFKLDRRNWIWGDRELLTQMYANLIENAIRHCAAGATIRLNVERHGNRIVSAVEDDGPGIPIEEREKVFQRLYRLEKSRTSPGTGLGLSLVKAVADLHGTDVKLSSANPGLKVRIAFAAHPDP